MEFFRTERLLIRRFEQRDATGLFDYFSAPRANCFASELFFVNRPLLPYGGEAS